MINSCAMHSAPFTIDLNRKQWRKALHLLLVGLYAFVLPFVCWGAQAAPGHPHALPHFVFAEPVMDQHEGGVTFAPQTDAARFRAFLADTFCGASHSPQPDSQVADPSHKPASQSTPTQLVIMTLGFVVAAMTSFSPNVGNLGFGQPLASLSYTHLSPEVLTHPPRA